MSCKVRVIGIGNPLMADDGIGPAVVEAFLKADFPDGVEVVDGGLGGMSLLHYFEEVEQVILVDAADIGKEPGQVVVAHLDDNTEVANTEQLSGHGGGIIPLLRMVRDLGYRCRVTLVAVQPATVEPHIGLTEAARSGADEAVAQVKTLLAAVQN